MDKENSKKEKGTRISQKKKKETFIEIFELSGCNVSKSCKKSNIARQTFYNWFTEDKEFAQKINDAQEGVIDMAESMLIKKVKEGSTPEILFLLKTKGKSRGYVERQEFAGVEEQPIVWKETKTYNQDKIQKKDIASVLIKRNNESR